MLMRPVDFVFVAYLVCVVLCLRRPRAAWGAAIASFLGALLTSSAESRIIWLMGAFIWVLIARSNFLSTKTVDKN